MRLFLLHFIFGYNIIKYKKRGGISIDSKFIINQMLKIAKLSYQKELAEILEITPAALSKYKKKGVIPERWVDIFLKKYPLVPKLVFQSIFQSNANFSKSRTSIYNDMLNEYSHLEKHLAETKDNTLNSQKLKDELVNREIDIQKLSGKYKKRYVLNERFKENALVMLPFGFCTNENKNSCTSCLFCENFLTSSRFLDSLKYLHHILKKEKFVLNHASSDRVNEELLALEEIINYIKKQTII